MVKVDHSDYMIIQVDQQKLYQLKQICICNFLITRLILFGIWNLLNFWAQNLYSHVSPTKCPSTEEQGDTMYG